MNSPAIQMTKLDAVTVARTVAEVEGLRTLWLSLPPTNLDSDIDHFLAVVEGSPSVLRPHVVHIVHDGRDLLVVARLVNQAFPLRVGYRAITTLSARAIVVSFGGILGARTPDDHAHVLATLRSQLRDEASVIIFQKVDVASPCFEQLQLCGPGAYRLTRPSVTTWSTELPESWAALLDQRSSKSRKQLRYDDNKLRRAYGDRLELRRLDTAEHRHRLVEDMRAVASVSYQSNLRVSVVDDPVQFALIKASMSMGRLRVWMLYVDQQPVAFWWGVAHDGTLLIGSPGFLPDYAKDRVGYYTLRRMIEDACADPAISRIDYGPGDADYKERFATSRVEVADVMLFTARAPSLLLRGLLRLEDLARGVLRAAAARSGRTTQLKQRLRSQTSQTRRRHA